MGRIRNWVRRLERATQDDQMTIIQKDGTALKFPADATFEAFLHEAGRLRAIHKGEEVGEPHALTVARRNAMYEQPFVFDADGQPRRSAQAE